MGRGGHSQLFWGSIGVHLPPVHGENPLAAGMGSQQDVCPEKPLELGSSDCWQNLGFQVSCWLPPSPRKKRMKLGSLMLFIHPLSKRNEHKQETGESTWLQHLSIPKNPNPAPRGTGTVPSPRVATANPSPWQGAGCSQSCSCWRNV